VHEDDDAGCMKFDWVMGCGLGWFVGPKFLLCDGLGQSFGGLGRVEEIELTDNSESEMSEDVFFNPISFPFPFPYC